MKRLALISIFVYFSIALAASEWLWPVKGSKTGDNVIYSPQNYIEHELNSGSLFIGGNEGDEIIAPFTGKIENFGFSYYESLTYAVSAPADISKEFHASRKEFAEKSRGRWNPRYASHSITLIPPEGSKMHISGLNLDRQFKSGETVQAGEKLGTMAYSYKNVPQPSIMINVSRFGNQTDPMANFGMRSTFKEPKTVEPISSLTAEQAKEDINILIDAIIDCYPSLDDIIAMDDLETYRRSVTDSFPGKISFIDFSNIMSRIASLLHDSHISHWSAWPYGEPEYWDIDMGRVGDSLKVVWAIDGFTEYLNRGIKSVDGISPDSVFRNTERLIYGYDANIEDYVKSTQFQHLVGLYLKSFPGIDKDRGYTVTFDNGETLKVKRHVWHGEFFRQSPSRNAFKWINRYRGKDFKTEMLNDSTAYIGLQTFNLDELSTDSIRDFIAGHITIPHLIVDVRNNGGGNDAVLHRILSYCSDKPYASLKHHNKINRRGHFASMAHCKNYFPEMEIFGEEYKEEEGYDGLYTREDESCIMPDSVVAYSGKLYVLVNENSCSAATLFPANILRSHRGIIIGRETRTAYSYMTALKFADFILPNSHYIWRIPLVKCIFDETISPRIPHGRGVIPDVYVPLTYDEVAFTNGDAILNRALQTIADGEYLSDNPFEENNNSTQDTSYAVVVSIISITSAIVAIMVAYTLKRRRKDKQRQND